MFENDNHNEFICTCQKVTLSDILESIEQGAINIDLIADRTKATTICGRCRARIQEILDHKIK